MAQALPFAILPIHHSAHIAVILSEAKNPNTLQRTNTAHPFQPTKPGAPCLDSETWEIRAKREPANHTTEVVILSEAEGPAFLSTTRMHQKDTYFSFNTRIS